MMPKSYREYTIERPDYSDTLKLRVYKTVKGMRQGSQALQEEPHSDEFSAAFHSTFMIQDEGLFVSSMYGIILLNEQNLGMTDVCHECIHAAFAHDRWINRFTGSYDNHDHEERFAYYYDWLLIEVLKTLKKAGHKVK
jgi:hypothetical protein